MKVAQPRLFIPASEAASCLIGLSRWPKTNGPAPVTISSDPIAKAVMVTKLGLTSRAFLSFAMDTPIFESFSETAK